MANGRREYFCTFILFLINLLNYVDRETVAGVLTEVQGYYNINDTWAGLIQTVFLVFFVIGSPICGYLGDRYNRKWVICGGMLIWVLAVIGSSFCPRNYFWLFMLFRGIVGIGEASYSNVSPSMLYDMFTGQIRNRIYMVYYLAVPFGSGLGYIVGSNFSTWTGHWQWGIRVSAIAGLIGVAALAFLVDEPERGASDKEETGIVTIQPDQPSSIWNDMYCLIINPTYINCIIAYTSLVFVAGTMLWWTPTAGERRMAWKKGYNTTENLPNSDKDNINMLFGAITCVSGVIGVVLGVVWSGAWQTGWLCFYYIKTDTAPALVCAAGSLIACPLMLLILLLNNSNATLLWILTLFCVTFTCLNWGLNVDIIMSIVAPWRRSTAFSWFMLASHLFGDGPGPYIVGAISNAVKKSESPEDSYKSLVVAFYCLVGLLAFSAFMYVVTAVTMPRDQRKVIEEIRRECSGINKTIESWSTET